MKAVEMDRTRELRATAANERFGASGGVSRSKMGLALATKGTLKNKGYGFPRIIFFYFGQ